MDSFAVDLRILERIAEYGFRPNTVFDIGDGGWTLTALRVFDSACYELFETLAGVDEDFATALSTMGRGANVRLHKIADSGEAMDAMVASGRLAAPDVVRMGAGGGELAALTGAQERCLPQAQLLALRLRLTRAPNANAPLLVEVTEFLRREDYYPYEFGGADRDPDGLLISMDIWFVRRKSALGKLVWQNRLDRRGAADPLLALPEI